MATQYKDIQAQVLDKIRGKINLLQDQSEKEAIALNALSELSSEVSEESLAARKRLFSNEEERKKFIESLFSYGVIEELMLNPDNEDIIINSLNPIFVHNSKKGLIKTDKRFESQEELDLFIKKLIILSGHAGLGKINNLALPNIEGRANIVLSPFGPQITITRAKEEPLSILHLIDKGTVNFELAAQLWLYVEGLSVRPANILIAGGPGVGKTTLLNALFSFMPVSERIVTIEDTLELNTYIEENCSRLESDDEVTMADLVKNSLRMRPDRVIVGEVRGAEARDLMTAMNIGKYCMGTLHASTAREAIIRLQSEPMNISETLITLIDVFIIMRKFHHDGNIFRVIGEVVETAGLEHKTVLLSPTWEYDIEKRQIMETAPSSVYRDRLCKAAGIKPVEVINETRVRAKLLRFLRDRKMFTIKEVSEFCRAYSADPKGTLQKLGLRRELLLR
jgi:flagellar protein FlaI